MKKKILVITPKFPFPKTGACEQDRGYGIEDMIRLGYNVHVISKVAPEKMSRVLEESKRLGIPIIGVSYVRARFMKGGILKVLNRLIRPWTWDGAAYEYYDSGIQEIVAKEIEEFKPDIVWFDYTYLWPLYTQFRKKKIPIITRSINFEPVHFLQEDGVSFVNLIKFLPKLLSEILTVYLSTLILSITPYEQSVYGRIGAHVRNLPLRGLPHVPTKKITVQTKNVLDVFFFGSTYNVHHNRRALEFLLKEVIPLVQKHAPGKFLFHILGAKVPVDLAALCVSGVVCEGYIEDLNIFMENMDIAVIPSLMGAGMQQKIFEPLVRGIPTIASARGIADYPFDHEVDYYAADDAKEFAATIMLLSDLEIRKRLSRNSLAVSGRIFSGAVIDSIVKDSINSV